MQTVFYSWQSDLPNATNRSFIESCLEKAIKELRAEGLIHIYPSPDRDTQGVPGSPDIAETIFEKIDSCAAFVGDVSFINGCHPTPPKVDCDCTRPTPNPNVLCEWGRATKSIDFERVLVVFNEATGKLEDLPFDMRKRRVVTYRFKEGDDKTAHQKILVGKLKAALKAILELPQTALTLEFADRTEEKSLGEEITIKATFYEPLPMEGIPKYGESSGLGTWGGVAAISALSESKPNRKYYTEKLVYLVSTRLMRSVAVQVQNTGDRLLRNVRFTATCSREDGDGIVLWQANQMPSLPSRTHNIYRSVLEGDHFAGLQRLHYSSGCVTIKQFSDRFKIEIVFGDIQPKASVFSEIFYAGSVVSQQVEIGGQIYADELASPEEKSLSLVFETEQRKMTLDDLENDLPEETETG